MSGLGGLAAAVLVFLTVLCGVAQTAPAFTATVHPASNAPNPLGRTRCFVRGGRVVAGPCTMVAGRLSWRTAATRRALLRAVDNARVAEGYPPLTLPAGFAAAGPAVQTLDLLNAERASRGLPTVTRRLASLDRVAAAAAAAREDPRPSEAAAPWGSVWGEGIDTADVWFAWMYRDGWAGSLPATENIDCRSAGSPGCWEHRAVLLGDYGPEPAAGAAATVTPGGRVSIALIISAATGPAGGAGPGDRTAGDRTPGVRTGGVRTAGDRAPARPGPGNQRLAFPHSIHP